MIPSGKRNTDTLSKVKVPIVERIGTLMATNDLSLVTKEVVTKCINGYLARATTEILPISRARCEEAFKENLKSNLVIIIFREKDPVGFLIARRGISEVSTASFIQQTFYNSTLEGVAAVKAVWVAHRVLIRFAERNMYKYAVSVCSPFDLDFSFNKILTKDGWCSEGHTSVYKLRN